jgi:hypothetical protein
MAQINIPPTIEIYLCDPTGVRIECLDYATEYEYTKIANKPAPFRIRMPARFDRNLIRLDNIVEIWRGFGPGALKLDYCGFLRSWPYINQNGIDSTDLIGYSTMDLLRRRIVKDYEGSAQSNKTGPADDVIKEMADEQIGTSAGTGRNLTSVGGGFTIQADNSEGETVTMELSHKNLLAACQELSDASRLSGTKIYFDIVPIISSATTGMISFQLQTYSDYRGNDHSSDSDVPIYIGAAWGNVGDSELVYSELDNMNYCYVIGNGKGESQETYEIDDSSTLFCSINHSIWNRCEGIRDARNTDIGDTDALISEGGIFLVENWPSHKYSGDITETPTFRYGKDWGFGDLVTLVYPKVGLWNGLQLDAMIDKVYIRCNSSGQEDISAHLDIELI